MDVRLDIKEGEKNLCRPAKRRNRAEKDVQQVQVIKNRDGIEVRSEDRNNLRS